MKISQSKIKLIKTGKKLEQHTISSGKITLIILSHKKQK